MGFPSLLQINFPILVAETIEDDSYDSSVTKKVGLATNSML